MSPDLHLAPIDVSPELSQFSTDTDRRRHLRFPISIPVEYSATKSERRAFTRDLSERGVFLETTEPLPVGREVRLSLDWPGMVNASHSLRLIASGKVIRTTTSGMAILITQYEYKLRPRPVC